MNPQVEAALIAGVVSLISLGGTVVVAVFGVRITGRTTTSTLAEQRARTLNERFAAAAGQLGDDKPAAVRLAGVYAMAALADDWDVKNRQTCVDVLCAYLRMPFGPDPGPAASEPERLAFAADREVRHTVLRVISTHLQAGAATSWQGLDLDFTGVIFDSGSFAGAAFSGGHVSFAGAQFPGVFSFAGARFSGGYVSFAGAHFCGDYVSFEAAELAGGQVSFGRAKFTGGKVVFSFARLLGGEISFNSAEFSDSSKVLFIGTEFTGGEISFDAARFAPSSEVSFFGAKFSGAQVHFYEARFAGGTVDFASVGRWSRPPELDLGGPSPGVKLPEPPAGTSQSTAF